MDIAKYQGQAMKVDLLIHSFWDSVTFLWLSLFVPPQWEEYEASDLMTPDQQRAHLDKLTKTTSENQVCWSFHLPHLMLKMSMILEEMSGELLDKNL